ncbi:unnamed protein product [Rotaria sordida]|uniref:Uncharacterized protein n=1 Tax=Rotaria sordida TaxID=392033 RepID=A0A820FTI6_9BILA|nr:unnamed protein product [Rotaria sordida]
MLYIFVPVICVLHVAIGKCKIIFSSILHETVSTMKAIHEEKCTALNGGSPMHPELLSELEKEIPIIRTAQGYADGVGNAVPIGQRGEIWTRTYTTMTGYFNDSEKTNETITSSS